MYNPSRGGVRGGADQFTWESVKTDKHRENYLGHSLKAPVGRWQKGKDLSWYAKERKDSEDVKASDKSELTAIKRAEQEAMLIALGHNVIRKENQSLSREEMTEALKRNIGDRDQLNIERVDGVGAKGSGRAALLSKPKNEGVTFETHKDRTVSNEGLKEESLSDRRSKNKKKSKKHKKEKKKRSHNKDESCDSENELTFKRESRNDKSKRDHNADDSDDDKHRRKKEKRNKRRHDSSDSEIYQGKISSKRKHRNEETKKRHEAEDSNDSEEESIERKGRRRHDTSDSDEPSNSNFSRQKKEKTQKADRMLYDGSDNHSKKREPKISKSNFYNSKNEKMSKHMHRNSDDSENEYHESRKEKYKIRDHELHVKRHRHDTSESD